MKNILLQYVSKFNNDDNEHYKQAIDNAHANEWLIENIPLIDIPDKLIEEVYYFRWWTFRKHIKTTADGTLITEFLPPVRWAGLHNTIIAAAGHHVSEGKWLKCGSEILKNYIKFWLDEKSKTYLYSSWIIYSTYELCNHINDFSFGIENLDLLVNFYKKTEDEHMTECGLFWSIDNNDAMEYSISGTPVDLKSRKGIRPSLNSYMAANAYAISKFAKLAGKEELSEEYFEKYTDIKEKITSVMWDGEFYKAIHKDDETYINPSVSDIVPTQNARELIGYIPWGFNLAPEGFDKAFAELKNPDGFKTEYGLTTAEQRHPRFLYEKDHECLWNGYIWPFATSQVLNSVISLLNNYNQNTIDNDDFYDMLRDYAKSHSLTLPNGKDICWIDEVKHPITNEWSSRDILLGRDWPEEKGGFERGKDYNHSTFCNIVLNGLLGIKSENGELTVNPKIPKHWDYFKVDNLWINDTCYKITFDKNSSKDILITQK